MTGCPTPLKIRPVTGNLTFQDIFREGLEGKIGAGGSKKGRTVHAITGFRCFLESLGWLLVLHHFNLRQIVNFNFIACAPDLKK